MAAVRPARVATGRPIFFYFAIAIAFFGFSAFLAGGVSRGVLVKIGGVQGGIDFIRNVGESFRHGRTF